MSQSTESSDQGLLDLLRQNGPLGIAALTRAMQVTATAVRQRLTRLMSQGLIERQTTTATRGRPSHKYSLTEKGRRHSPSNFADLTVALWKEVRAVKDLETRRGLLERIAKSMASMYGAQIEGSDTEQRMHAVSALMADRSVPFVVEKNGALPVLTAQACPYPDLAEQDRGICSVEKMLFSELLGEKVRLSECRLDGASCCRFETN